MSPTFRHRDVETVRSLPEERHPVILYLAHLGPGSRRTMTEAAQKIARIASGGECDAFSLPWHTLRIDDTRRLRDKLSDSMAPATANKHLAALRGVLKQAWRMGLMTAEDYQRAIDLQAVRGESPRPSRALSPDELHALIDACERDGSPAGARDCALFGLLFGAGLRRSEVVGVDLADYDAAAGALSVRPTGNRGARRFLVSSEAQAALDAWLERRGSQPGPLFNPINKGGRIEVRRLSEQAIYVACRKRAAEAGLPPVSPEDLRRSLPDRDPRRMRSVPPVGSAATAQSA